MPLTSAQDNFLARANLPVALTDDADFELLRSITFSATDRTNITQKLFGRGWAMMRVDVGRCAR